MNSRKLEALRNLAERPGTEAEGRVARAMLEREQAKARTPSFDKVLRGFGFVQVQNAQWSDILRYDLLVDPRDPAAGYRNTTPPNTCECGASFPRGLTCPNTEFHHKINMEVHLRFQRGARVFYNRWAYDENCPGYVVGYSKWWNWIRIKFDHLKQSRSVPIYSAKGWHLSTEPVDAETLRQTGLRG